MSWLIFILVGAAEVTWAIGLKYTDGFKNLIPSIVTIAGYIASLLLLELSLKKLSLGTAYAVWTGIGIVGTSVLGVILFREHLNPAQVFCIFLIISGIVGLKILSN